MAQRHVWQAMRIFVWLRWRWSDTVRVVFVVVNAMAAGVQFGIRPFHWIHFVVGLANVIAAGFGYWVISSRVFDMKVNPSEVIRLVHGFRAQLERVPASRGVHEELKRLELVEGMALEALHGTEQGADDEASGDSEGVANVSP